MNMVISSKIDPFRSNGHFQRIFHYANKIPTVPPVQDDRRHDARGHGVGVRPDPEAVTGCDHTAPGGGAFAVPGPHGSTRAESLDLL